MNTQTNILIKAEARESLSKSANRKLRLNGFIPGVLYSKGKSQPIALSMVHLPKEHTRAHVVNLELGGHTKTVLMREVQVNPLTDKPIHFDFQEVSGTDKIRASVPLDFIGFTREQEKLGTLGILVRYLDVVGTLSNLPASIPVDVSGLTIGSSVRLFDLQLPKDFRIRTGKGQNVALATLVVAAAS